MHQPLAKENGLAPLEIQSAVVDDECSTRMLNRGTARPRYASYYGVVTARYLLLAMVALGLTVACPGDTVLWNEDGNALVAAVAARLLVSTCATLGAFFFLVGSDPGYLTAAIMADLDEEEEDVTGLLDEEQSNRRNDSSEECDDSFRHHRNDSSPDRTLQIRRSITTDDADADAMDPLSFQQRPTLTSMPLTTRRRTRRPPCETCQLAPPLRAHHCKKCNQCVATFDHHCDLTGTCIGERNHCRFWWFLLAQTLAFLSCCGTVGSAQNYVGLFTLLLLPGTTTNRRAWMDTVRVSTAKLYLYPLTAASCLLLLLHTLWCLTNSTTFECAKGRELEYLQGAADNIMDLPFSQSSVYGNVRLFCCQRGNCSATIRNNSNNKNSSWRPIVWIPPGAIVRDSEDWWRHPLQNKYWSCC
jgi:hypothetical protein